MVGKPFKEALLDPLAAAQGRERALLNACDDQREGDSDAWTARDHLVHLAHWRRPAAEVSHNSRAERPPEPQESFDEINARVHEANRDRPASLVKTEACESYQALRAAIEATTEEQLRGARPGRPGALWEMVPGDGHLHAGLHLSHWLQSRGEEGAAEEVQVWMRDLHVAAFPTAEQRANAEYNLEHSDLQRLLV